MSFIQKIKYNYYLNNINGLIEDEKYDSIHEILDKFIDRDNSKNYPLIKTLIDDIISRENSESFFKKNLIWLNAFNNEDLNLVNQFLCEYFNQHDIDFSISNYHEDLFSISGKDISFADLVNNSYFYQFLLSRKNQNVFLRNQCAFFVSPQNKFFTHKYLSKSFIYIIKNPYHLFNDLKKKFSDKNLALNDLFNLDHSLSKIKFNSNYVEIVKESWKTNLNSWSDHIVNRDLRGLFLKFEDLKANPEEFLSSILLHFKELGLDITIDFKWINKFIDENQSFFVKNEEISLSQKEIKFIEKEISETLKTLKLNYTP